jgi:hypothetical protein
MNPASNITLLFDLELEEVSLCTNPANPEATVTLFKSADAPAHPSEPALATWASLNKAAADLRTDQSTPAAE